MRASYEKVTYGERQSFFCRRFDLPAFDSPWHFHPEVELTYIVSSTGTRFVGDSVEPYEAGDLVLLGSNLPHHWCTQERNGLRHELARSVVILFREDFLGLDFLHAPELHAIPALLHRASRGLRLEGAIHAHVEAGMQEIAELPPALRLVALLELLVAISRAPETELRPLTTVGYRPNLSIHDCERLDRVHQYVLQHLEEELQLATAAELIHMSPSAFCRYFKRHTGKTFVQFVNELRVGRACRELMESDRQVGDIAHGCGFNSISNFNRRFRQVTGRSPSQYRQVQQQQGG